MNKLLLSVGVMCLLSLNFGSAEARNQATIEKEVNRAAQTSVHAYKAGGVSALIQKVESCYDKTQGSQFYCLYLDVASRHIDQTFSSAMNFPPSRFFSDKEFMDRIIPILIKAEMTPESANEYMIATSRVVINVVDRKLAAQQ